MNKSKCNDRNSVVFIQQLMLNEASAKLCIRIMKRCSAGDNSGTGSEQRDVIMPITYGTGNERTGEDFKLIKEATLGGLITQMMARGQRSINGTTVEMGVRKFNLQSILEEVSNFHPHASWYFAHDLHCALGEQLDSIAIIILKIDTTGS